MTRIRLQPWLTIRHHLADALDRLLGPRCPRCGTRVFPADQRAHDDMEHAGEQP
ncbi:MAG: zinc ribbon domain-containing protein [Mycobacteriales bacterium]